MGHWFSFLNVILWCCIHLLFSIKNAPTNLSVPKVVEGNWSAHKVKIYLVILLVSMRVDEFHTFDL